MKTLTELKRTLTPGTVLVVTQHEYPNLIGERTVTRTQGARIAMTIPDQPGRESWLTWPKREYLIFADDGTVTMMRDPEWGDAGPFMTFTVKH